MARNTIILMSYVIYGTAISVNTMICLFGISGLDLNNIHTQAEAIFEGRLVLLASNMSSIHKWSWPGHQAKPNMGVVHRWSVSTDQEQTTLMSGLTGC